MGAYGSRIVNRSCSYHEHEVQLFHVHFSLSSNFVWKMLMKAPQHTPYEGGMFAHFCYVSKSMSQDGASVAG